MPGNTTKRYPAELKCRAVRMVAERAPAESEWAAMQRIAPLQGVTTAESLRKRVSQAKVDAGARNGTSSTEFEELHRLRRENADLKRGEWDLAGGIGFVRGRA